MDDDETTLSLLAKLLRSHGYATSTAASGEVALVELTRNKPSLVLSDLHMAPVNGVELCRRVHDIDADLPVIVMSAQSDMRSVVECMRAGARDYLLKPLDVDAVFWCVERTLAEGAARREQAELYRVLNQRLVLSSIREQEHAEAEARHRAQSEALLQNVSEGVAIVDRAGRVTMINDAARAILGFTGEATADAINALDAEDLHGRPLRPEQRPLMRALRGEQFVDYEVLCARPSGERRRVVSTGTCVRDASGDVELAIVMFRDVTELRRLEQQREEYLALISHDLRNPLSTISMLGSLLKLLIAKGTVSDEGPNVLARVDRNVRRIISMLDELSEATTLESGKATINRVPCDLRQIVAGAVDTIDDARAARIVTEVGDGAPVVVLGEPARLERVVANLLTNALKYSADDAPVVVRFARAGSAITLQVIDRGIGLAPGSTKMLFERYYRTPNGKARATGLGLGLYISRLIVEAHGGHVDVRSDLGKGSTFSVQLPASGAPA